ncbi:MAG: DUF1836 domain-containing protein [Tissierellia bacterium]|nr:DUF1836 domain-containing protein [Tissierellia bacterium]
MHKESKNRVKEWKILRYDELPDFDLYIDQLIHVAENQSQPLTIVNSYQGLTPSMVNNYVKNNILPPPVKKKYKKEHIAILIVISFLKSVFSINEIKQGIEITLDTREYQMAYDEFCDFVENAIKKYILGQGKEMNTENKALYYACESIASKLFVQYHLENINIKDNEIK